MTSGCESPGAEGAAETRFLQFDDPDGTTRWRVDVGFLSSDWRCIWAEGCQGIEDDAAPELHRGCCSVGVVMADEDEAMLTSALAPMLDPAHFQFHETAAAHGVFSEKRTAAGERATRVVDGACIFLNRPGFEGGMGCALHQAALMAEEDPLDWKPYTCWKVPLRIEEHTRADGGIDATLRAWNRSDWGDGGTTMAWWCTDTDDAFVGDRPAVETLRSELTRLLGAELYSEIAVSITGTA